MYTDDQPGCADGDVRLVGGPNVFEGRVEICFDEQWGQVCGREWHKDDGEVVCRQLGYIVGDDTGKYCILYVHAELLYLYTYSLALLH